MNNINQKKIIHVVTHLEHEFYPAIFFNKKAILGKYFCKNCFLEVFIGASNMAYKGTYYDGKILHHSKLKNGWINNFIKCSQQIIKNLLE